MRAKAVSALSSRKALVCGVCVCMWCVCVCVWCEGGLLWESGVGSRDTTDVIEKRWFVDRGVNSIGLRSQ